MAHFKGRKKKKKLYKHNRVPAPLKTLKCIFAVYLYISLQFSAHELAVRPHSESMAHLIKQKAACAPKGNNNGDRDIMKFMPKTSSLCGAAG